MKAAIAGTGAVGSARARRLVELGGACREVAHGGTVDLCGPAALSRVAGERHVRGARGVGQQRPGPLRRAG
ncbi:hypothetical protein [Streptomyces sp. NPDC001508]|uniref:hypothetical protein n=1 Tax=Streptomyces sp. NPDC001508 TaxID=3154656 RepID=UPI0033269C49